MQATLSRLEYDISQAEMRLRQEHFGDSTVKVYEGNPNYDQYDRVITQLVERYPESDNGSKFIESYVTLVPKIVVTFQKLQPLLAGKESGSLLLDEVARAITVFPLTHGVVGSFTTKKCVLVVSNARPRPGAELKLNTDLPKPYSDAKGIHINATTRYGYFDANPQLMKMEFLADIEFGDYVKKDMVVELTSTGDGASTQITIPLEPERVHITPDGSVLRKNCERFNVSQITNNKKLRCVNHEFVVAIPFKVIC